MGMVGIRLRLKRLVCWMILALVAGCSSGHNPTVTVEPGLAVAVPVDSTCTDDDAAASVIAVKMRPQAVIEPGFRTTSLIQPDLLTLNLPVPRTVSDTGEIISVAAADYDPDLSHHNVEARNDFAVFQPDWYSSATNTMDDTAYCSYGIDLNSFTGIPTLSIIWTELAFPVTQLEYWVGIANYDRNCWDFFEGPLDQVITLESLEPYTSDSGRMVVVPIMASACRVAVLEGLKLGVAETRATGLIEGEVTFDYTDPDLHAENLPASFNLSAICPPVCDQLEWGACTAFAVANGAFNMELYRIYSYCGAVGWSMTDPACRVSPKYIHVESGKNPNHSNSAGAGRELFTLGSDLRNGGIATEQSVPYDGIYADDWSEDAQAEARLLKPMATVQIQLDDAASVNTIRHLLYHRRQAVFIGTYIDDALAGYVPGQVWSYTGPKLANHSMLIIGYDDELGAFKVRNSWGTGWGDGGYCWIAYDSLLNESANTKAGYLMAQYSHATALYFLGGVSPEPPPVNVQVSRGSVDGTIHLTWDSLIEPDYFEIYRDNRVTCLAEVTGCEWTDEGITDSLGHTYWVKACYSYNSRRDSAPTTGYLEPLPAVIESVGPVVCGRHQLVTFEPLIRGDDALDYSWDFGAAATPATSTEPTPTVLAGAAGIYSVHLEVTGDQGSDEYSFYLQIADNDAPEADFTTDPSVTIPGNTVTFDAGSSSDPSGRIVLYEWDWEGDGTYDLATTTPLATHAYGTYATYHPALRITDDGGLTATTTRHVIVPDNAPPVAVITVSSNSSNLQPFCNLTFSAEESVDDDGIAFYEWDLDGDGFFEVHGTDQSTASKTYKHHEMAEAVLRVTDGCGLTTTCRRTVQIGLGHEIPGWVIHHHVELDLDDSSTLDLSEYGNILVVDADGRMFAGKLTSNSLTELTGASPVTGGAGISMDSNNHPIVSYYADTPQPGLYYAVCVSSNWEYSPVWTPGTGQAGLVNDISQVTEFPAIAFSLTGVTPAEDNGVFYARGTENTVRDTSEWEITRVLNETTPLALELGNDNYPAIACTCTSDSLNRLVYTRADTWIPAGESSWTIYEPEPRSVDPSMVNLNLGFNPVICYALEGDNSVQLLQGDDEPPSSWLNVTVETGDNPLASADVTYCEDWNYYLCFLTGADPPELCLTSARYDFLHNDMDWTTTVVDTGEYGNLWILEYRNEPRLVFYDRTTGWLYSLTPDD